MTRNKQDQAYSADAISNLSSTQIQSIIDHEREYYSRCHVITALIIATYKKKDLFFIGFTYTVLVLPVKTRILQ